MANTILTGWQQTSDRRLRPPIPVDDIAVYHLAIQLEFVDLNKITGIPKRFGQPTVLGCSLTDQEFILIDNSLDPTKFPSSLAQYYFTVAHEIGHMCLHANSTANRPNRESHPAPDKALGRERQADYFAICLLMPRHLLRRSYGHFARRIRPMHELTEQENRHVVERAVRIKSERRVGLKEALYQTAVELMVLEPLAKQYCVPKKVMRKRMRELGM